MTTPVYTGMPPTERTYRVPKAAGGYWPGRIICGGSCRDDYARLVVNPVWNGNGYVKLQRSAWLSFKAAEDALGFAITLTGSWRSCADQTRLYRSDSKRYANPNTTAHTRGLAIDVSQDLPAYKLALIHDALTSRGWHQARADEPWHYSFGIEV